MATRVIDLPFKAGTILHNYGGMLCKVMQVL